MQATADQEQHEPSSAPAHDRPVFVVSLLIAAGFTALYASMVTTIAGGGTVGFAIDWVPRLGVSFGFRIDGLALLFSLLISGIGVLIITYTQSYMAGHRDRARLQILLVLFMLSMLGLVGADNILVLFIFWELTTLTSFLLVGFDHEEAEARRCALQALLVTGLGGLALLVGLIMMGQAAGSYQLSEILADGERLKSHPQYAIILTLVLLGAFAKSAQFPLHFWLPNAMAAPTPVSAYLHSATMVKAGIYLMARVQPGLGGTDAWFYTLAIAGAITAVWASMMALRQSDMKQMLAWTTIMALGTITLCLASDSKSAALAGMTFLVVHAFYKCALFLVAGLIDHGTGTRDIRRLGGLVGAMPITALAAIGASISMAGFPPSIGFIGKELNYKSALAIPDGSVLIAAAMIAANAMMVTVGLIFIFRLFLTGRADTPESPHEGAVGMWIGPVLLAIAGLVTGVFPALVSDTLLAPAISSVLQKPAEVSLSLWHGINLPLILSVVTVAIGVLLFVLHQRVWLGLDRLVAWLRVNGDDSYDRLIAWLEQFARRCTDALQSGSLSRYLTVIFTVFVVTSLTTLIASGLPIGLERTTPIHMLAAVVALVMAIAAVVVAASTSRLLSICALGVVGAGVAVLFMMYSAIDVAITQLMVETLFVVLMSVVILRLPAFSGEDHPGIGGRWRDGVLAIGAGLVVTLVTLGVSTTAIDLELSRYFAEHSYEIAKGKNIVNVILVDFRALDTLGEVAVVVTAALAVIALLKVRPKPPATNAPT